LFSKEGRKKEAAFRRDEERASRALPYDPAKGYALCEPIVASGEIRTLMPKAAFGVLVSS